MARAPVNAHIYVISAALGRRGLANANIYVISAVLGRLSACERANSHHINCSWSPERPQTRIFMSFRLFLVRERAYLRHFGCFFVALAPVSAYIYVFLAALGCPSARECSHLHLFVCSWSPRRPRARIFTSYQLFLVAQAADNILRHFGCSRSPKRP